MTVAPLHKSSSGARRARHASSGQHISVPLKVVLTYNHPCPDGRGWGTVDASTRDVSATESPAVELADLLSAVSAGDRCAFATLYQATSGKLFAIAITMLRRRDLAEETLQEAYLAIWQKAALYDPTRGEPLAWMASILRYRAIDRLRALRGLADQPSPRLEDMSCAAVGGLESWEASPLLSLTVRRCLGGLPDQHRHAILLAFYHGLTHEELAARLDAPLGTVKSWVRRGLLQLKDCLDR